MSNSKKSSKNSNSFDIDKSKEVLQDLNKFSYKKLKNSNHENSEEEEACNIDPVNSDDKTQTKNINLHQNKPFDLVVEEGTMDQIDRSLLSVDAEGDKLKHRRLSYSETKCCSTLGHPLKLEIKSKLGECPLSIPSPSSQAHLHPMQSSPIMKRRSSIQFRKLSFRRNSSDKKSCCDKNRVTLLGKPVVVGAKSKHNQIYRQWQTRVFNFLEQPKGFEIVYHIMTFFLVLVCLIFSVLATIPNYNQFATNFLLWLEIAMLFIFTAELSLRLWSARCRCRYQGWIGFWRFCKKPFSIIDIVVVIASVIVLCVKSQANMFAATTMKSFRFLQILRMVRVDRKGGTWKLLTSVVMAHSKELVTAWYMGFLTLIFASFLVYQAEKDLNYEHFSTYGDGLWWGLITLTTIGYGDKYPITCMGSLIACGFTILGISFFTLPAGILGSGFALKVQEQHRQKHFARRRMPAAFLIQCTWRCYAADKNSSSIATWAIYRVTNFNKRSLKEVLLNSASPLLSGKQNFRHKTIGRSIVASSSIARDRAASPSTGVAVDSKLEVVKSPSHGGRLRFTDFNRSNSVRRSGKEKLTFHKKYNISANAGEEFVDYSSPTSSNEEIEVTKELNEQQKSAIRCLRAIKFMVARRKFKEILRPYDVKDVLEQYSSGHLEMLTRIKNLQTQIDFVVGVTPDNYPNQSSSFYRSATRGVAFDSHSIDFQDRSMNSRLCKVESHLRDADQKLDLILKTLRIKQNTNQRISGLEKEVSSSSEPRVLITSSDDKNKLRLPLNCELHVNGQKTSRKSVKCRLRDKKMSTTKIKQIQNVESLNL